MTPDVAHHPVFAVAEAACLVLATGALAERATPAPRLVPPFLVAGAAGMALAPAGAAPRLLAALLLLATAALLPFASRRMAHLAAAVRERPTAAPLARIAAALGLTVLAVIFAATSRPSGEPVAIALAVVLVGLLAATLPATLPQHLVRLALPGGGLALLAATLPGAPASLLVMPVLLPLLALLAGSAILGRVAGLPPDARASGP